MSIKASPREAIKEDLMGEQMPKPKRPHWGSDGFPLMGAELEAWLDIWEPEIPKRIPRPCPTCFAKYSLHLEGCKALAEFDRAYLAHEAEKHLGENI